MSDFKRLAQSKMQSPAPRTDAETAKLPTLVTHAHGLNESSSRIVVETMDEALKPFIQSEEIGLAFVYDDDAIYMQATRRLWKIAAGVEELPCGDIPPLERAKWGRGYRRCLTPKSQRAAEDIIILALAPFVTSEEVAWAIWYEDCLIFDVRSLLGLRLRQKKTARHG